MILRQTLTLYVCMYVCYRMYSYLADAGIDGVKVDAQSGIGTGVLVYMSSIYVAMI